jgi:hypothetical protein
MPCTSTQQAHDRTRSASFMRNFYASLGMSKQTLERALRLGRAFRSRLWSRRRRAQREALVIRVAGHRRDLEWFNRERELNRGPSGLSQET